MYGKPVLRSCCRDRHSWMLFFFLFIVKNKCWNGGLKSSRSRFRIHLHSACYVLFPIEYQLKTAITQNKRQIPVGKQQRESEFLRIWVSVGGTITLCTSLFLLGLWSYSHWVPFTGSPIQLVAWSKAWVCSRSLAGIAGSNPAGDMDVYLLWVLCVVK